MKELTQQVVNWTKDFLNNVGKTDTVLGISGGKDSSVVAAICVAALGKEHVHGILLPCGIQKDISDYFRIKSDIANIKEEIEDIKHGGFGMLLSMSSRFISLYRELFPRDISQETKSIARLNKDIANCKKEKDNLYTNLMKYYKNEISYLRQYV